MNDGDSGAAAQRTKGWGQKEKGKERRDRMGEWRVQGTVSAKEREEEDT